MSYSLRPHGLQHTRLPCPSPTLGAYSDSYPSRWWCHPTISSSHLIPSHLVNGKKLYIYIYIYIIIYISRIKNSIYNPIYKTCRKKYWGKCPQNPVTYVPLAPARDQSWPVPDSQPCADHAWSFWLAFGVLSLFVTTFINTAWLSRKAKTILKSW